MPWYNNNWLYRVSLTTDSNDIPGALTAFPTPIIKTIAGLTKAQADADDILFTLSNGTTKIPHHVEHFNGATGELVAKVKMDHAGTPTNDLIYCYYGHSSIGSQQDAVNTYDTNFKLVLTLNELPTAAAPQFKDLTSNANNGTANGSMTADDSVAGKVRNAIDFDGTDDYISIPDANSLDITGDLTVKFWVKWDTLATNKVIMDRNSTSGPDNNPFAVLLEDVAGTIRYRFYHHQAGGNYSSVMDFTSHTVPTATWEHVAFVRNLTAKTVDLYINGAQVQQLSWATDNPDVTTGQMTIAADTVGNREIDGQLDDIQVSNSQRSANWLAATYNTVQNAATFWTVGAEESPQDSEIAASMRHRRRALKRR